MSAYHLRMSVRIAGIGTALPPYAYAQSEVKEIMRRWIGGERRVDRLLERVYGSSGIEQRFSVLGEFLADPPSGDQPGLFRTGTDAAFARPGTGARNERYGACAPGLVELASRRASAASPAGLGERVTHVITVSCTGFQAPGLDDHLVRALGLPATTERYHVGFMGCYAVFPALRMARAFCLADPEAVVLVASVELCTLHLDPSPELDDVVATAVFADGAAAALVSASQGGQVEREAPSYELLASATTLTEGGKGDMAWTIGDHGFEMVLSSYVPRVLEAEAEVALAPLLRAGGVRLPDIDAWAVHPGGRAILDKLQSALALPEAALAPSRAVLAAAGNMSSASVLFVLQELQGERCPELSQRARAARPGAGRAQAPEPAHGPLAPGSLVAALAFGPGLTVDSALLRVVDV